MVRNVGRREIDRETTSGGLFALPFPVVEWSQLLRSLNPGRTVSRGLLRSLRAQGRLSSGITVTRRAAHGLAGRATYNSGLWAWSERFLVAGFEDDAQFLRRAATDLEGRFRDRISTYLATHDLDELPAAAFFEELMHSTVSAIAHGDRIDELVLAAGTLQWSGNGLTQVVGRTPGDVPATVDLPQWLLFSHRVVEGDAVWVLSRKFGDAALVEVEPMLLVGLDHDLAARLSWTSMSGPVTETDESAAERYDRTAALLPDSLYWDDLVADARAGKLPARRLRPVG